VCLLQLLLTTAIAGATLTRYNLVMDEQTVTLKMNERTVRALSWAVDYSLATWSGQGDVDQEMLLALKPCLHGCMLEFMFELE